MKKTTKKYGVYFNRSFTILVDELLSSYYTSKLKREDFFHFFYILQHTKNYAEKNTSMKELPRGIRSSFGKYIIDGKQIFKFKEIVDICESLDITVSSNYSNFEGNKYSKHYGFTTQFSDKILDRELEFVFCEMSSKTINTLKKRYHVPTTKTEKNQFKAISKLNIDIDKARTFLSTVSNDKYVRYHDQISTIVNNDFIVSVQSENTGRTYTSFNLMKRELREFCTLNGESLDSLDLKSSQPYLVASILLKKNPYNREVLAFYNLVVNSDIYDWVIDKLNITSDDSRTDAKKLFFSYLYKKNQGTTPVQNIMMKQYPEVYELIKDMKRKEDLWQTMQTLEADIFIKVADDFNKSNVLSVHDALYFPVSMKEEIKDALKHRFNELGLKDYKLN